MRQVESRRGSKHDASSQIQKIRPKNNKRDPLLFIKEKYKFIAQNDRMLRKKSNGCEKEESYK